MIPALPCPTVSGHPKDAAFCLQWGFKNTGQTIVDRQCKVPGEITTDFCWEQTGTPGIDVNILPAWEFTTGSPLVTVAVLDSGTAYCNPDFDAIRFFYPDIALTCIGNESVGFPCCPDPGGPSETPCAFGPARDNVGHGTFVASIIAAKVNNAIGIAGMDQQCKLPSCRVFGDNGTGLIGSMTVPVNAARAVVALELIVSNPAYSSVRMINISDWMGNDPAAAQQLAAFEDVVDLLAAKNRFVVAGAGNGGLGTADTGSPAKFASAITVGAIDSRGWRMAPPCSENHPLGSGTSSTGASLDFVAPGMAEVALICQSNPCPSPECAYPAYPCRSDRYDKNFISGTSVAAPKVASAISLILAEAINMGVVNPTTWVGLSWQQVYDLLKAGARDQVSHTIAPEADGLDTGGRDDDYGWGLIDVRASLCELHRLYGSGCE